MEYSHGGAKKQARSFRHSIIEILNKSSLALMISIGHRTGLFDTMKKMTPATAHEIAREAGLAPCCVREWLGIMAVGDIVEYDPEGQLYFLPSAHAALLSRLTQDHNLAVLTQWISATGAAEDELLDCFTQGQPIPEGRFQRLHEVIAEENTQTVINTMFEQILPMVPELLGKLTHGMDVLEVGCGKGRVLNLMARAFPSSRFAGIDSTHQCIEPAREEAQQLGLDNVTYNVLDLSHPDISSPVAHFDLIMAFDAMPEQAYTTQVLAWIRGALKPDGFLLFKDYAGTHHLEEDQPDWHHALGPFFYARSSMVRMMTAPSDEHGREHPASRGDRKTTELLHAAGFRHVQALAIPRDPHHYYLLASPTNAARMEVAV